MQGQIYVGTSGWSYTGWKESFYAGVPQKKWLSHCAELFTGIEVNATFYRLQTPETFTRWRNATPESFRFAIKANRYLTHNKKLKDPEQSIVLERERALGLSDKLAAVLWQLPQKWQKNLKRLQHFAACLTRLWPDCRHVLEFRHPSWFSEDVAGCLAKNRLAVCLSDAARWPMWQAVTTDLVYVRLHGHERTYASIYDEEQLRAWCRRIRQWCREGRDVHVYFDNDAEGAAPRNALRLLDMVKASPEQDGGRDK